MFGVRLSSIKKRIIVRRTVRSVFSELTVRPIKNGADSNEQNATAETRLTCTVHAPSECCPAWWVKTSQWKPEARAGFTSKSLDRELHISLPQGFPSLEHEALLNLFIPGLKCCMEPCDYCFSPVSASMVSIYIYNVNQDRIIIPCKTFGQWMTQETEVTQFFLYIFFFIAKMRSVIEKVSKHKFIWRKSRIRIHCIRHMN